MLFGQVLTVFEIRFPFSLFHDFIMLSKIREAQNRLCSLVRPKDRGFMGIIGLIMPRLRYAVQNSGFFKTYFEQECPDLDILSEGFYLESMGEGSI